MGRNRTFNVHGLYPEDYCFDQAAFEADPEGYQFTSDDIAYFNAMELERYETSVPMITMKDAFFEVGHIRAPSENPGSRYICLERFRAL